MKVQVLDTLEYHEARPDRGSFYVVSKYFPPVNIIIANVNIIICLFYFLPQRLGKGCKYYNYYNIIVIHNITCKYCYFIN